MNRYSDGVVNQVLTFGDDHYASANIKRGLLSLLQVNMLPGADCQTEKCQPNHYSIEEVIFFFFPSIFHEFHFIQITF